MNTKDVINHFAESLDVMSKRKAEELRKLCDNPTLFDMAQVLADSFEDGLTYLCNFDHAVNNNGGRTKMIEVIDRLREDMRTSFEKLTGMKYRPEILRTMDFRKAKGI